MLSHVTCEEPNEVLQWFFTLMSSSPDIQAEKTPRPTRPLAERMRPLRLEEVRGQSHLLGKDCLLPKLIRENRVGNLILAGPPGTGKTTLATVIAEESKCKQIKLNAVTSNVTELRESLRPVSYTHLTLPTILLV